MPLNANPAAMDAAILALLTGSAALTALVGSRVYDAAVPDGSPVPFVAFQAVSDVSDYALGKTSVIYQVSYLVRAVSDTRKQAGDVLSAADAALQFATPAIAGLTVLALAREGGGQRYIDTDGFSNATYYYRLIAQGA